MAKQKVKLGGVAETLLIPLWARAEEWDKPEPIIMDEHAVNLVKQIDYDFSKFKGSWMTQVGCSARAGILDVQTKRFIQINPEAAIINIGAGLDTRFFRVDNGKINWYELDLPQSTEVRKKFFSESKRHKFISKSVFDFSWIKEIKEKNKQVLIIAEGTLMYFSEKEVKQIFDNLIENFSGAEALVEVLPKFFIKQSKRHETLKKIENQPVFKWGIKHPKEIKKINSRIEFLDALNIFDYHKKRWKWFNLILIFVGKYTLGNSIVRLKLK